MKKRTILYIIFSTIILALIITIGSLMPIKKLAIKTELSNIKQNTEKKNNIQFGIKTDSLIIFKNRIQRNQNLAEILKEYNISAKTINEIAQNDSIFNVKKIRPHKKYTVFCTKDTVAKYFVYEPDSRSYITIKLADTIKITLGKKKITNVKRIASGFIQTNLWNSMIEYDIDPMMSIELSEIYAWSIDFFGLQKGDHFSVIYDEEYVDTTRVGIGKIYSAVFNHKNKDFFAISFKQDSSETYFDSSGQSLQRAFLKAPLRYSRISSHFTYHRFHPILKIYRPHTGVDYAAPIGTPVHTVGDGIVIKKKYTKQGGRVVKIKHNSVYTTGYAHFSRWAKGLKVGQFVKQGQIIGYVGKSGLATGPHLDFRFWKNGKPVDPLKVESPSVEPIKKINLEQYKKICEKFIIELKKADKELHNKHPELAKKVLKTHKQDLAILELTSQYNKVAKINKDISIIEGNPCWKIE